MTSSAQTRIYLADDHPVIIDALSHRIAMRDDMLVCGHASDPDDAFKAISELLPDILILDIVLKGGTNSLHLINKFRSTGISLKTIIFSIYPDKLHAELCVGAGAMGYVCKESDTNEIIKAIETVRAGGIHLNPKISNRLVSCNANWNRLDPLERLTNRQLEIFRLIGEGKGQSQIAKQLHLSVHTVESHRENIKTKLGLTCSTDLLYAAILWEQSLNAHGDLNHKSA